MSAYSGLSSINALTVRSWLAQVVHQSERKASIKGSPLPSACVYISGVNSINGSSAEAGFNTDIDASPAANLIT